MKITKSKLKQLIKEELQSVLDEAHFAEARDLEPGGWGEGEGEGEWEPSEVPEHDYCGEIQGNCSQGSCYVKILLYGPPWDTGPGDNCAVGGTLIAHGVSRYRYQPTTKESRAYRAYVLAWNDLNKKLKIEVPELNLAKINLEDYRK
jgi:hypothetical protein